jgi:hypothetical protein
MRTARRTGKRLLMGAIVAVALCAGVAVLASNANNDTETRKGDVIAAGAAQQPAAETPSSAGIPLPVATSAASSLLRRTGTLPGTAVVYKTSRSVAEEASSGARIPNADNESVYLFVYTGNFTDRLASVPPSVTLPHGKFVTVIVDEQTAGVVGWGISDQLPSSASLPPGAIVSMADLAS